MKLMICILFLFFININLFSKDIQVEDEEHLQIKKSVQKKELDTEEAKNQFHEKISLILKDRKKKGVMHKDDLGRYYTNGYYNFTLHPEASHLIEHYIEYKINDNPFTPYTQPIPLKDEGHYKLIHRGVDELGNVEEEQVYNIIVDKKPPEIVAELIGTSFATKNITYYKPGVRLDIRAYDRESGLNMIIVSVNNKGNLPVEQSNLVFTKNGQQRIQIRAMDNVFNLSKKYILNFQLDALKPTMSYKTNPELKIVNSKTFCKKGTKIFFEADDTDSGIYKIEYSVDNNNKWIDYRGGVELDEIAQFVISYRAIDNVGNVSNIEEFRCNVDKEPPNSIIRIKNLN